MQVLVIGLWHQGLVGATCLAHLGHRVEAYDLDAARRTDLQSGRWPVFEPGLDELARAQQQAGRLVWLNTLAKAAAPDALLLMHDTPVNERDESDPSLVFDALAAAAPQLRPDTAVLVTAQVPVGTCDALARALRAARPDWRGGIAYAPENLRLGQAIERFLAPPLPVIGSDDPGVADALVLLWPADIRWERTTLRTAEMVKHALNGFLAATITFANELGNLCDEVGADGHRIAEILRREPRVGSKAMLFPGLGFAGGTLARDVQTLRSLGDRSGLETPFLDGLWRANNAQNGMVLRKLRAALGDPLRGRVVALLGLTYKPDTSTLRRSAAVELATALLAEGAAVRASDPKADRAEVAAIRGLQFFDDPMAAAASADAIVLMTPGSVYRSIDLAALRRAARGAVLIDTAPLWTAAAAESAGWVYLDIGRGRKAGACRS